MAWGMSHLQDELVNYLSFAVTGYLAPLNVPPCAMYLDAWLGGQELYTGDTPKMGPHFIAAVAIEGFPAESCPSILAHLETLAIQFRFSQRFIPLDAHEAMGILRASHRKWKQRTRGFFSSGVQDARRHGQRGCRARMAEEAEHAITDASSNLVVFGYYTPVLILMGESRETIQDEARIISRELRRFGFASRIETVNTLEAFLGSVPGHTVPNVRRPLLHSLNFADFMPASSTWPGLAACPSPLFPPKSPPLLYGATSGSTPFRLNLHVGDVGHTLIFGPTGAGKSTLLALIAAQFRRYKDARITAFDKGRSLFALVSRGRRPALRSCRRQRQPEPLPARQARYAGRHGLCSRLACHLLPAPARERSNAAAEGGNLPGTPANAGEPRRSGAQPHRFCCDRSG